MKQHFIIKNNQKHLLLFFAGWGMDETPFLQIRPTNKDWLICYDYRSLEFDAIILQEYSEITLIAWSMGVWAASQIMKQYPSLPLSQRKNLLPYKSNTYHYHLRTLHGKKPS